MIEIGKIKIDGNALLAPMSGVTDLPFRRLVKSFGAPLVISEMIASRAMILQTKESMKKCQVQKDQYPMSVQIAGCEPEIMAQAAKLNEDLGADIIDINFGCPVKKVVNSFAGSALMKDEDLATRIMEAVVNAVKIPVTMKMRLGWNQENLNAPSLAKKAQEVGIKMLTVHGRTRCQMYNGNADWQAISRVKEAVTIPVIANGDIKNFENAKTALELSKADGVMIGRACYGKPWLISQLNDQLSNKKPQPIPNLEQQLKIVLGHFNEMIEYYGVITGIALAKKHIGWYSSGLNCSSEFRAKINLMGNFATIENSPSLAKKAILEICTTIEKFYESQHNFLLKETIN